MLGLAKRQRRVKKKDKDANATANVDMDVDVDVNLLTLRLGVCALMQLMSVLRMRGRGNVWGARIEAAT